MTALQASIGSLNDVVDAPRDAGHKPGKPIPAGLVSAAIGAGRGRRRGRPRARPQRPVRRVDGRAGRRRPRDRVRLRPASSRGPPGRGSRSRSASRCCPCSAGLARPAACRPPSRCCCPSPSWPGPGSPSPTPGPTSSATRRPGSIRWRSGSGPSGRGRSRPLLMTAGRRGGDRDPGCRSAHRSHRWPSRSAPDASSPSASRSAVGATAPGSSGPGSSRRSASGCWRRRGWPGSTGEPAGTTARRLIEDQYPASSLRTIAIAFSSRSLAIVRYFARFARSVDADGAADLRIAKDADELVDRFDEPLLRVDQRVVGQRARRRGLGRRPRRVGRLVRGVGLVAGRARGYPRRRHRMARPPGGRRPSILSRSLMSVSSPRATCSASRRRFFGSSTFISS